MKTRFPIIEAIKSVKQKYRPTSEILALLNDFRLMTNDCIRIGLKENVTSTKSLSLKAYHQLSAYNIPTCYRLTAISKAAGILRNYRRELKRNPNTKVPYVSRLTLTDCYGFRIFGRLLRLPISKREYVFIIFNNYALNAISRNVVRSVSLTDSTLSIAFSKEVIEIEPRGAIGIDRNLDNVTTSSSDGTIRRFDLSEATRIKSIYREAKSHYRRNDARVRRRIYGKFGLRQENRVTQVLHNVSKKIVNHARESQSAIVMERLTGIRKLYRKGNRQSADYRAKLNSWSYYELQRQIEYKAKWNGIPVIYVPPQKTSSACATCGSHITECTGRKVWCPQCETLTDRDVNAARNILAKGGVRFAPDGLSSEAMVEERAEKAPILKVDDRKVAQG